MDKALVLRWIREKRGKGFIFLVSYALFLMLYVVELNISHGHFWCGVSKSTKDKEVVRDTTSLVTLNLFLVFPLSEPLQNTFQGPISCFWRMNIAHIKRTSCTIKLSFSFGFMRWNVERLLSWATMIVMVSSRYLPTNLTIGHMKAGNIHLPSIYSVYVKAIKK